MKLRILIISFAVFFCYPIAKAQRMRNTSKDNYHYVNQYVVLGGGLGYSNLFMDVPSLAVLGNIGGCTNIGYEIRTQNGFWLNIGAELQCLSSSYTYTPISGLDKMIYDTQGKEAMMHYDLGEATFKQEFLFLNIPLILGYHYNGLFLGGGAKIGYGFFATESAILPYITSSTYQQYIDDFSFMPDHFNTDYSSYAKEKLSTNYKVSVMAEISYDILTPVRNTQTFRDGLKIGVFAEYGLNNLLTTHANTPLFTFDDANASVVNIHSFYNTIDAQSYKIHPFFCGMRVAWVFNIKTNDCPTCKILHNYEKYRQRYNRIQH